MLVDAAGLEPAPSSLVCRGYPRRQRLLYHSALSYAPEFGAFARTCTEIPALRGRSSAVDLRRRMFSPACTERGPVVERCETTGRVEVVPSEGVEPSSPV